MALALQPESLELRRMVVVSIEQITRLFHEPLNLLGLWSGKQPSGWRLPGTFLRLGGRLSFPFTGLSSQSLFW